VNVPTREGFLHLAFILDTHSPRIVGWSMPWRWRYGRESPSLDSCIIPIVGCSTRRASRSADFASGLGLR
jgi:hypothetical protein